MKRNQIEHTSETVAAIRKITTDLGLVLDKDLIQAIEVELSRTAVATMDKEWMLNRWREAHKIFTTPAPQGLAAEQKGAQ